MSNINFKNLFTENCPVIHNEEYVSNKHFLIKKSILKKSQLDYINTFPLDTTLIKTLYQTLKNESEKPIITEFIPQLILEDTDYNILITEIDRGYKGCNESISKIYPAIQEEYYNFFKSLKCTINIVNNDQVNPLAIYNNDNEFVGIILPIRVKDADERIPTAQDYKQYLDNLKATQEAKELSKQNSKKCLYIKDNKAVVRNKELTCIADIINDKSYNNLYVDKSDNKDISVYTDLGVVCLYVRTMSKNTFPEDIKYYNLDKLTGYTLDMALDNIHNRKSNNQFINVADIKLIELSGASKEKVQELIDYRQEWYSKKEKEDQEERLKREQLDKEYIDGQNKIVDDLVLATEQAILNNQEVENKSITIYKSRYSSNDTSLILHMMKLYDINVPIKTQGWINQALANIYYEDNGKVSYSYYKSSANSNVFGKYLNQLIEKVKDKYKVAVIA